MKLIIFFSFVLLLWSCTSNEEVPNKALKAQKDTVEQAKPIEKQKSSSKIEIIRDSNYFEIQQGIYSAKSPDQSFVSKHIPVIHSDTFSVVQNKKVAFLKIHDNPIALFSNINDSGKFMADKVLRQSTFIQVDSIFYKAIYASQKNKEKLSFNVWYAISIGNQHYYTDYKIHDLIAHRKKVKAFNQEIFVIAQSTGYDEYYANGYPNHFLIVVLNQNNQIIYESDLLNFDYGYEFFDNESIELKNTEKGVSILIKGANESYNGLWDGEKLQYFN